jgi:predicted amidohydrolase YtcJ
MLRTATFFNLFLLSCVAAGYGQAPDVILVDGKIFTGNRAQPYAEALAISQSRITAVGSNAEIRRLAGRGTRRIDLDGRTVVPGFNDAHTHFHVKPRATRLEFRSMEPTWAEVSDALRAAVKKTPAGHWIIGQVGGTAYGDRKLNRASLDRIARDHPVVIETFYGHGTVVNTAAMKLLGIAERPADPLAGSYERDPASGRFNGRANEYANWIINRKLADLVSDTDALADLKRMGAEAAAFGVTTLQVMPMMRIERFVRLLEQADLPVRVRAIPFSLTSRRSRDMTEIRSLGSLKPGNRKVKVEGIKWIVDGTPFEHGAAMRSPYADRQSERGRMNFSSVQVEAMLRESLWLGEPILLHAVGDRTIEIIFDAMEKLRRQNAVDWKVRRVRIEHADALSGDLVGRAKRLGVVVVQNPTHFLFVELFFARWSPRMQFENQRTLIEAGIPYAIGSDGPMNPGLNIMFASAHPSRPSESISRSQAVEAYTFGSAFAEFAEREKGILKAGMLADLAVLSQDIFSVPPDALPATRSVLTIVDGRIVYDANKLK